MRQRQSPDDQMGPLPRKQPALGASEGLFDTRSHTPLHRHVLLRERDTCTSMFLSDAHCNVAVAQWAKPRCVARARSPSQCNS